MIDNLKIVILSGGVGSRLWPLSRKSRPKQYLNIFNEKSLFDLAVERNRQVSENFLIVGNQDNSHLSKEALEKIKNIQYKEIIEALPRNTSAAIAFAAFACEKNDILLITPSDHIIEDVQEYKRTVEKAVQVAEKGFIVTFGITPAKPETGYGYIESEEEDVISFREKPEIKTAESFIESGNFYWNSGMFCFRAGVLLEELKNYEPEIYETALIAWNNNVDGKLSQGDMNKIPSKSIDYAVMERSKKIKIVKADFGWSDLGSFESLYDYFSRNGNNPDENGNMYIGTGKYTHFLGVENCILVQTEDANLVLNKEHSQKVKNIYEELDNSCSELVD